MRDEFISNLSPSEQEAEKVVEIVRKEFEVLSWTLDGPRVEISVGLGENVGSKFRRTMDDLKKVGFLPALERKGGRLGKIKIGRYEEPEGKATTLHYVLLLATILTTLFVGSMLFGVDVFANPLAIWRGWPFSASILLIIGSHELGHYFSSGIRSVIATPPYFIPVPFALGTLGAVIKIKSPIPDRNSLFDIGAAGPFTGFFLSIPITLIGLYLSPITPAAENGIILGEPIIFRALGYLIPIGEGGIHPVAFAGWVGFFITFLNLIPVGQLDGGHIVNSLIGKYHGYVSAVIPLVLFGGGVYLSFLQGHTGGQIWIFWGLITLFFHKVGRQDPLNTVTPLDRKRKIASVLIFVIMIVSFTPIPLTPA